MNSHLLVIQAIAGVTFQRIFRYLALIVAILYLIPVVIIWMLMQSLSPWWGIFFVVLVPIGIFLLGLGYLLWRLAARLLPRRFSHEERQIIYGLSSKILAISEQVRTPMPLLAAMIAIDILRRRPTRTIEQLTSTGHGLRHDIEAVTRMVTAQ